MSIDNPRHLLECVGVAPIQVSELPRKDAMRILPLPDLHIPASPPHRRLLLGNRGFLEQHDWVILLGDITNCYGTVGEYRHVRRFIEQLDRPYSVVNGNHEFSFLPAEEESREYGRQFVRGSYHVQCQQFARFEQFYGIETRYQAGRANGVGFCLLGVDQIGPNDEGQLDEAHERWLAGQLDELAEEPLLIFSHFPLCDGRLDAIRYYEAGRKPYLLPSPSIRRQLADRRLPTFWFSGHLHFAPTHPLAQPYQTEDGIWQIHCPDGRGYGRPDDELWHPQHHDGLFVRSIVLQGDLESLSRLSLSTVDLRSGLTVDAQDFDLLPQPSIVHQTPKVQYIAHSARLVASAIPARGSADVQRRAQL